MRWLRLASLIVLISGCAAAPRSVDVVEAGIPQLQGALDEGTVTSRELVHAYLARIATFEPILNAAISVNPRALDEADALDRERASGRVRGPLHGIPIAVKDNIQVDGMPTTGGALAFRDLHAPYEADLVKTLRAAGAIIIAKTTMNELASWTSSSMPSSYNAVAGFSFNPYSPVRDQSPGSDGRPILSTGGSSSGVGTAASLWAANVGTDTGGSILVPAQFTMLVGVRPTVGRLSTHGVIPLAAEHDTPGPMARTVTDAALLLGAMEAPGEGAGSAACPAPDGGDYTRFLDTRRARGMRVGVPLAYFVEPLAAGHGAASRGGISPEERAAFDAAITGLAEAGVTVLSGTDVPAIMPTSEGSLADWPMCSGTQAGACSSVLFYGMKRDFNAWLRSLGAAAPVESLSALRAWNTDHAAAGAIQYGQDLLDRSDAVDLDRDHARATADRARDLLLTRARGLDAALTAHSLDALVFPGWSGAAMLASRSGYPAVIVPAGWVPNRPRNNPSGAASGLAPYGISFVGSACSEGTLLSIAYAFEQQTRHRTPPTAYLDSSSRR